MAAKMVLAALKHIWATLEPTSCSHALIGGLSLSFWKHVRTTQDVDLLIDSGSAGVEALLEVLKKAGIRTKRQPPIIDLKSLRIVQLLYEPKDAFMEIQIDLLLAESEFHREALARRVPAWISEMNFEFSTLSCEDLIIMKMNAGRIIDRADAAALLRLNRESLNLNYLLKWVKKLNLNSEWSEIWNESSPDEPIPGLKD